MKPILPPEPVIIVGMHRSGTTMLVRLLEKLGFFFGRLQEGNSEERFYLHLNDLMLKEAYARWDAPEPFLYAIREEAFRNMLVEKMRKRAAWGERLYRRSSNEPLNRLRWGWKDPRTTLTLPVWEQLYPRAKFIHIYRHPVDVAMSLRARELKYAGNLKKSLVRRILPFIDHGSRRCLNGMGAYSLWEAYTRAAVDFCSNNERCLQVKYEDILQQPLIQLERVLEFLESPLELLNDQVVAGINDSRAFAYRHKEDGLALFEEVRERPLVRAMEY